MKVSKIKSNFIFEDIRLNAGYFLNEDALNSMKLESNRNRCISLGQVANVWNPPIFKRQFCEKTERSIPYCQSSDVTNLLEGSDVYIYKEQALKVNSVVKENQILVTGFGTIGNTRLVNELSSGISYANNVCRIEANEKLPFGYIYAFLTSKYGRSQLNKNASGSVVRYIEAPGIKKTLIPILSAEKQQQIHQLIVEASELRVEANRLLNEAIIAIEGKCPNINNEKMYSIKIRERFFHSKRLEANYNSKSIDKFYSELSKNEIELKSIAELSQSVFTPNIFKRIRTENPETGIPFLSGSELLQQYPRFQNYLSKGMKNIENYVLKDGWLAIQDAGTIGYLSYIHKYLDGVTATNNLIRIIPSEDNYNYYIYAFLKSDVGQKLLKFLEFGSVQKHIDNHQISNFKIPIFKDVFENISRNVENAMNCFSDACFKENQAIALIEKEIDLWQVS
ncbi:hypothetical protein CMT44_00725 [Elizabethkingia anophelis]|nr:hypothetical protein [Elizabethkingia anophelis]MDV3828705.1 hypothetical protein [Elizabethkingia anophelis]MDV4077472.1 hypothetical protein [Elizabethkingia anophelis]